MHGGRYCVCQLNCATLQFLVILFMLESENMVQVMFQKIIQVLVVHVLITALLSTSYHSVKGSDEDENLFFTHGNNNKFFFNTRKNCQPNYYFDIDFFKCRLCDGNFLLMTNDLSELCYLKTKFIFSFFLIEPFGQLS